MRCMNCMSICGEKETVCPVCAGPVEVVNPAYALKAGTVLQKRYLVGKALHKNGEGISYLAYDNVADRTVYLKEFFPMPLVSRSKDGMSMDVPPQSEDACVALVKQFVDLNRQLQSIGTASCVAQCFGIFDENDTIYAVNEKVNGVTLQDYLNDHFGELSWEEAEYLFIPLLHALNSINSMGISHCGIHLDNLMIDQSGAIKLCGFCIAPARTVNHDVEHELFAGYSAPEQYVQNGYIGEWSDVYAVCAVMYRTLTGTMPPKANSRAINDVLAEPAKLNETIPKAVSKALQKGLNPNINERTANFKQLIHNLYHEAAIQETRPVEITPAAKATAKPAHSSNGEERLIAKRKKMPLWLLVVLISLPIALGLFWGIYAMIVNSSDTGGGKGSSSSEVSSLSSESSSSESSSSSELSSSSSSASVVESIAAENFVGKYYADYADSEVYQKLYTMSAVYQYDDTVEKGLIIKQSIEPDKIVPKGEKIEFAVSKGSRYYEIPAFTNDQGKPISLSSYAAILDRNAISHKTKEVETNDQPEGSIVKLNLAPGSKMDREKPQMVTIYIAKAIPEPSSSELEPSEEPLSTESQTSSASDGSES